MKTTTKARKRSQALARAKPAASAIQRQDTPGVLGVFERLAKDPKLTVDKLGQLIELQERIMQADARAAFDAAYARMLPEIPTISRRGEVKNKEGKVQSRYSKYEDIRAIVDPILQRFGFQAYSRTEWPETGIAEVVGILTHDRGHSRESRFRAAADASGGKNAIQGLGSAVSYGKRYTLIDLLAIVCKGVDDDGQAAGRAPSRRRDPELSAERAPIAHTHAASGEEITQAQRQRLVMITRNSGRGDEEVKRWLAHYFGIESSKQIRRSDYDFICRAIEGSGELPRRG